MSAAGSGLRRLGREDLDREGLGVGRTGSVLDLDGETLKLPAVVGTPLISPGAPGEVEHLLAPGLFEVHD